MEEQVPLTQSLPVRVLPATPHHQPQRGVGGNGPSNTDPQTQRRSIVDEGSLELLEHLIAIVLQGNAQYLETLLQNEEILEVVDLHDNKGFTALHIASERLDLESVRLLLEAEANPNVMDRFRRTALHWVVSGGCHCSYCDSKRAKCTELLLRAKGDLEIKDVKGETPLSYAIKNSFNKVAEVMIHYGAQTNDSINGINTKQLILQKIPGVMTHLLDRSVVYDQDDNAKLKIDFSLFQSRNSGKMSELKGKFKVPEANTPVERNVWKISNRSGGNGKEMALVEAFLKTLSPVRESLLMHPVTLAFLHLKWLSVRKWFWFIRFLYWAMVILYTYFVVDVYLIQCPYSYTPPKLQTDIPQENDTDVADEFKEEPTPKTCKPRLDTFVIAICIASWLGYVFVTSIYNLIHSCRTYCTRTINVGWWILIALITLTILPIFGILGEYSRWQYLLAAAAASYAWCFNLYNISRVPFFGDYMELLAKVLKRIFAMTLVYSSLFAAFAIGFAFLMPNVTYFKNIQSALLHTYLMIIGSEVVNYSVIFNNGPHNPYMNSFESSIVLHICYIGFVVIFGIGIAFLLIALVVTDVQELRQKAELNKLIRKIVLISELETKLAENWILNCFQRCILKKISIFDFQGRYFRFSPFDSDESEIPNELKGKFIPLLHTRDCLNKDDISHHHQRQHSYHQTLYRNDPFRGSGHSYQSQQRIFRTSPENIDEILQELKARLEGAQRRRPPVARNNIHTSPTYC